MEYTMHTMSDEELQRLVNMALASIAEGLEEEGYVEKGKSKEIMIKYSVIVERNTWLPKWVSEKLKLEKDRIIFRLVKAIGR